MPGFCKRVSGQLSVVSYQRGFTLVELLVVFGLMAILSGVGFASLATYSRSQALSQAAADVKLTVEQTRSSALSNVRPAACNLTNVLESYELIFCSNGYNPGTPPVCSTAGIQNNQGYVIQARCGNQVLPVFVKKVLTPLNVTSTCNKLTYLATNAAFSAVTTSPFPCTVTIGGYANTKDVKITSQGYAQ